MQCLDLWLVRGAAIVACDRSPGVERWEGVPYRYCSDSSVQHYSVPFATANAPAVSYDSHADPNPDGCADTRAGAGLHHG